MFTFRSHQKHPRAAAQSAFSRVLFFDIKVIVAGILFFASTRTEAQTSYPMITHTFPGAVQRGKTSAVVVQGVNNLYGAYQATFEGPGISAEVVNPPAPKTPPAQKPVVNQVRLKVSVAPDALPGIREFRLASTRGISSIGQIVIVDDPVVTETSVNNTLGLAQAIQLPCVVAGMLEAIEDVDYFKFAAQAGQVLTFEVYCARLQDKIHDLQKHAKPMLALFDAAGRELAANDHFYFADPLLTFTVQKTGTYYLQVRESTYDGDRRWVYALLATNRPYVTHIYPMAGNPGQMLEVEPVGSAKAAQEKVRLQVPNRPGIERLALDVKGPVTRSVTTTLKTNPATLVVSPLPQFLEQEPNDEPGRATRVAVPGGINGRIGKPRDLDHYAFAAKKGRPIQFDLMARRFGSLLNSSLHGVLEVMDGKGAILATSDMTHSSQEASLVFNPSADGDFVLRVRDLNSKGGDSFVYFIQADLARPDFKLKCDPDKAMIGPGSSTAWYVQVERTNGFTGPVEVAIKGLPQGVTASPLTIPPTMTHGVIVLTAAADAKTSFANVEVLGKANIKLADGKQELTEHRARSIQEIYNPGGGRNFFQVNMQTVAVTEPSDILKVLVNSATISLKPGEEVNIDVTIERRPDYNDNVSLDVKLQHLGSIFGNPLPPGVTIVEGKSKTLLGKGSAGHIVLKCDAKAAPIDNVPICVLAHVSINFVVKVSYASPPIWVSVAKK